MPSYMPPTRTSLLGRLLCGIGIHAWDGHAHPDYPTPRCSRCGRWHTPRTVVQQNIICGGDVSAGSITHSAPERPAAMSTDAQRDHAGVDALADAMKVKLARKRAAGRGGWHDPVQCPPGTLARMLLEHVSKGDPVDIANFAMMLHARGETTAGITTNDQVAALQAEVARLTEDVEAQAKDLTGATRMVEHANGEREQVKVENAKLTADVAQLRYALEACESYLHGAVAPDHAALRVAVAALCQSYGHPMPQGPTTGKPS